MKPRPRRLTRAHAPTPRAPLAWHPLPRQPGRLPPRGLVRRVLVSGLSDSELARAPNMGEPDPSVRILSIQVLQKLLQFCRTMSSNVGRVSSAHYLVEVLLNLLLLYSLAELSELNMGFKIYLMAKKEPFVDILAPVFLLAL